MYIKARIPPNNTPVLFKREFQIMIDVLGEFETYTILSHIFGSIDRIHRNSKVSTIFESPESDVSNL